MPQPFLPGADIVPSFQEIGREGMPQDVTTDRLGQSRTMT